MCDDLFEQVPSIGLLFWYYTMKKEPRRYELKGRLYPHLLSSSGSGYLETLIYRTLFMWKPLLILTVLLCNLNMYSFVFSDFLNLS